MKTLFTVLTLISLMSLNAQEKQPTNKHFWYSMESTAAPDQIWALWTNVSTWKTWDIGLKDATMDVPFGLYNKGTIISLEGRKSKFKVIEYQEGISYTIKTSLPLGSLRIKRYLSSSNGITTFTHEVWFTGLTKGIFAKAFGAKFREMLPEVLENVKQLAEQASE